MMVLDASVWISFLVKQDTHHAVTKPWMTQLLQSKIPMAAPLLLLAEIGGAMSRRLDSIDMGERAIKQLLAIPTLHLVTLNHALGLAVGQIAARYRLRGADAYYVAIAAQLDVPLVSWDQEHISRTAGLVTAYVPGGEDKTR